MTFLDTLRLILAFFVVGMTPPSILLWVAIHPFAAHWRRIGPVWTYVILGIPVVGFIAAVWVLRKPLLGRDLGTNVITMIFAGISLAAGALLKSRVTKQLRFHALSGIPELSKEQYPGKLLTEGIFGRVRNPRYIEVFFWILAYALFANYVGAYVVVALYSLVIYFVVRLEEKELRQRFGAAYDDYCRRVPRFIPRLRMRQD